MECSKQAACSEYMLKSVNHHFREIESLFSLFASLEFDQVHISTAEFPATGSSQHRHTVVLRWVTFTKRNSKQTYI